MYLKRFTPGRHYATPGTVKLFKSPRQSRGFPFSMKDTIVLLLRRTAIADILTSLWQIMLRTVEPIRPGRKYPRHKTAKHKRFAMTYKPLR